MTGAPAYVAALAQARADYAALKVRREELQRDVENAERQVLAYRRVIVALADLLEVPTGLLPHEEQSRRFRLDHRRKDSR